jgi:predicted TIM-barrel fold metal-dependent hydrolase
MKRGMRVVDADAHVIEPDDLWERYVDVELRDRAPRHLNRAFGVEVDGIRINLPADWERDTSAAEIARRDERINATFEELFPAAYARGFDAPAQLDDMDVEGVDLAFLYPSFGLFTLASSDIDPVVAVATSRAYNDWLADFCGTEPARLQGIAMVPVQDPVAAAREARRAHDELGFRGVFLRPNPIGGRNLDDPAYDPLWETLSGLGMALGLHEGGMPPLPQMGADRLANAEQRHICSHPMEQMVAAVSIVYGGLLERFPGLRVAFLESGCGWVPFWLERMDDHFDNSRDKDFGAAKLLQMPPSEYFRRQCYVSSDADESMLEHVIALLGDDRIVFSTDYPHPDSMYPVAVDSFLALPGVSDASKRRILWDNALDLYGMSPAAVPAPGRGPPPAAEPG